MTVIANQTVVAQPPVANPFQHSWIIGAIAFSVVIGLAVIAFSATLIGNGVLPVWAVAIFIGGYIVLVFMICGCCYGLGKYQSHFAQNFAYATYVPGHTPIATHQSYATPSAPNRTDSDSTTNYNPPFNGQMNYGRTAQTWNEADSKGCPSISTSNQLPPPSYEQATHTKGSSDVTVADTVVIPCVTENRYI